MLRQRMGYSDRKGIVGGFNTYAYVEGNPTLLVDPDDLKGIIQIPGYSRPQNAAAAAGYFQPQGTLMCVSWNCPSPLVCKPSDRKKPSDFMPTATDDSNAPPGGSCREYGYTRTYDVPVPSVNDPNAPGDFFDAGKAGIEGTNSLNRGRDAARP
jgi:hypothetical protein